MKIRVFLLLMAVLPVLGTGCRSADTDTVATIQEVTSPAGPFSREPNITVDAGGQVYMSWIEVPNAEAPSLKFAARTADGWTEPRTIVQTDDILVNYADFPSLLAYAPGKLAAHWLAVVPDREGYAVNLAVSSDNGATWTPPVIPHRDDTPTEHGFAALAYTEAQGLLAVWLDGRQFMNPDSDDVQMMYSTINPDGTTGPDTVIDTRVCECCQTSAVAVADGILVAYRDRSDDEIRDIAVVRFDGSTWSEPAIVAADGWEIYGCPINGPAIAASGSNVVVAWFTGANDQLRVQAAFSNDGGKTFGPPIQVDDGNPLGRVDVVMLESGNAIVSWLERAGPEGEVRAREVEPGGMRHPHWVAGQASVSTSSGFPRMERSGNEVIFAWTDSEQDQVRTSILTME